MRPPQVPQFLMEEGILRMAEPTILLVKTVTEEKKDAPV